MILVDTSVWIDHLRLGDAGLIDLLNTNRVAMHPFVLGELACGNLQQRAEVMALLKNLPRATMAQDEEVLFHIESHNLMGRGMGYIEAHLLAAVALSGHMRLWTRDKRLQGLASELDIAHHPVPLQ
ncbi:MAG: type II toxin-antitoxin system VapC family toxin [Chromatiales bacterium]|nr:type II toxin-antitoxin system VapC family toxin [Gammaproteobacteria bacterium]MBW6476004.1 type II toxin-antitoxin system VapC family toxin [Chromatiales bacterium]